MGHTGPSSGRPAPRPEQTDASTGHAQQVTQAQPVRAATAPRHRYRRVLSVAGAVVLTVATFAAMLVTGALVTNRGFHQAVPTTNGDTIGDTVEEAPGAVQPVSTDTPVRHERPLVVALVAGTSGTVASDLLAPYDIFASSPAFHPNVVAAHAGPDVVRHSDVPPDGS